MTSATAKKAWEKRRRHGSGRKLSDKEFRKKYQRYVDMTGKGRSK